MPPRSNVPRACTASISESIEPDVPEPASIPPENLPLPGTRRPDEPSRKRLKMLDPPAPDEDSAARISDGVFRRMKLPA